MQDRSPTGQPGVLRNIPHHLSVPAGRLIPADGSGLFHLPNLRFRCWYERTARRKSILRKAGHGTSQK